MKEEEEDGWRKRDKLKRTEKGRGGEKGWMSRKKGREGGRYKILHQLFPESFQKLPKREDFLELQNFKIY